MHRHRGLAIIVWGAVGLFLLSGQGGTHVSAQPQGDSRTPAPGAAEAGPLIATGRGRQPWRSASKAQARLMAKRAAMVEAYKNMAGMLGMSDGGPREGTGGEHVEGFIRGARLKETRYYANGDVEVDLEMTIPAGGVREGSSESAAGKAEGKDRELLFVEKGGGTIGESEWREILGKVRAPGH